MHRVLVTGGCGFIGSNFIRRLLRTDPNAHITNLDCLTYAGNPENLADIEDDARYRFVRGDIADAKKVKRLTAEVETVFHFAAESHVDRSIHDAQPFVRTNIVGTQVLLEAARLHPIKRFVHISTDEVYGSSGPTGAFSEQAPLAANNPYAASKAAADLLVRSYCQTYRMPAVITRSSNNFGPYQFPEKLIPYFIARILQDETVPLYGDGLQVRDWIHVADHCRAIELVWRRGRIGEVYNIGGGCEKTNLEVTRLLLRALGKPESLIRFVADRPGHDRRYALDCRKIETELGWRPQIPFEQGLLDTLRWYQENTVWVAHVLSGAYRQLAVNTTSRLARAS
ncbi:MAG: dTDP-glucose 4,6-dehydratase [Gemmataceae bacterium]|nr:dTDP-glucose 4,6-dehydratase [Gemmataceae bacterium]MCI0739023.1 dTDP-glucose 4,6-dehydratase [Gemmataceae bacterium]